MKKFSLAAILTVVTRKCLCPDQKWDEMYDLLHYLTGERPATHQLMRFAEESRVHIINQYPWMRDLDPDEITKENWKEWLADKEKTFGETLTLKPNPVLSHTEIDPLLELESMMTLGRIATRDTEKGSDIQ